jgi:ribose transport system substrate-binding protein
MRRLLLLPVLLAGCGGAKSDVIAVIPKGTTHEFWKSVHAGAVQASRELGVRIEWKGPLKEDDREEQIKVVENFVNLGAKGIVLAPLDDKALRAPVANAVRAGIPVVIIDSDLDSQDHASFVATDNRKGGELAGEQLGKLLGGRGDVLLLRYAEGSASTMNREAGFLDAIARFPGIRVVSKDRYGGATTESAMKESESLINAHKGPDGALTVQGIFCPNESSAFGMLVALQQAGQAGKVKFIGFDSSPKLVEALEKGHLHATVVQDPIRMGYLGVVTLVEHLKGVKVDRRIDTGATLVTPENMKDARIQELIHPPYAKWLDSK